MLTTTGNDIDQASTGSADDRVRTITTAGVTGLAVGAFLLSYDALHQLARTSHVPALLAWLWPLIVDGFILVASLAILDAVHTGRRARYPWLLVLAFSTLSVTFNVLHAPDDLVARLVAAIPPLALVLSFELLMRQIHHRLQQEPSASVHNLLTRTGESSRPPTSTSHAPQPISPSARPRSDAPTEPSPPGQQVKATRSPRAVTQARAEAVRDDCTRDGQPLTTALLADRLGISPGYARRLLRDLSQPGDEADRESGEPGLRAVNE
ncbi:hypothetical protein acdb102_23110 [Acidothermaceae bacterium B102]|nr:hypothetical protein acdb102_23110 [Acidothermaceae bacterium B102]